MDLARPLSPAADEGGVTFRLFAAARAAAEGAHEVRVAAGPADRVLAELVGSLPARFEEVLSISSLMCDGVRVARSDSTVLPGGAVVDVLPPFAGG